MKQLILTIESKEGLPLNGMMDELWANHPEVTTAIGKDNVDASAMIGQLAADGVEKPIGLVLLTIEYEIYASDDPDEVRRFEEFKNDALRLPAEIGAKVTEKYELPNDKN